MDTDHRREPREPIAVEVRYIGQRGRGCDYTDNVSRGGMFVLSTREWPPDQRIRFFLSFPRLLDPVDLEGVIRWRRHGPIEERGYGVEFVDPDATTRGRLDAFLARVRSVPGD
jgi:uncharacterized protein (TIGR02266 family)